MKITYEGVTDAPHFHRYKNAEVIQINIECDCGCKERRFIILEKNKADKDD